MRAVSVRLYRSSPLHESQVGVPDAILLKPGKLTPDEFRNHGSATPDRRRNPRKRPSAIPATAAAANGHRDCPSPSRAFRRHRISAGLQGQAIPLAAPIVALADVYDALTTARVYKAAFDPELSLREMIEAEEGRHFDPVVVNAFRACYEEFRQLQTKLDGDICGTPRQTCYSRPLVDE